MKRSLILLCLFLNGCATASITTKSVDGKVTECTGSYYSVFRDLDSMSLSACGGKGGSTGSRVNSVMAQELIKVLLAVP